MRLFDSHCHLDFQEFDRDRPEVLARAKAVGVVDLLVPGFAPATWARAAALARATAEGGPRIHLAVGLHPYALGDDVQAAAGCPAAESATSASGGRLTGKHPLEGELASCLVAAARRYGAVAIGECGVDALLARRTGSGPSLARQLAVLREHVVAADTATLPLVLHVVRAHEPVLALLRASRRKDSPTSGKRTRGVVHAFSGSVEVAREYVREGFMLAFGGALTHPRHERARAAARAVGDEHLLVESDAPSGRLADGPARNEPSAVHRVVTTLAQLRGQAPEHVAELTLHNARALYRVS